MSAVLAFEVCAWVSFFRLSGAAKLKNLSINLRYSLGCGFDNGATGITAAM